MQGAFLLYSMCNLDEPVQYIEIEVYYAEVQCSIFYTMNLFNLCIFWISPLTKTHKSIICSFSSVITSVLSDLYMIHHY